MSIVFLCIQGEAGEIAREEGVDFANADALRLDFKNILKIDNLWMFQRWAKKTSKIHHRGGRKLRLWLEQLSQLNRNQHLMVRP